MKTEGTTVIYYDVGYYSIGLEEKFCLTLYVDSGIRYSEIKRV